MPNRLEQLIAEMRDRKMTDEERSAQRKSFAFGNANIENSRVTREVVNEQAEKLAQEGRLR